MSKEIPNLFLVRHGKAGDGSARREPGLDLKDGLGDLDKAALTIAELVGDRFQYLAIGSSEARRAKETAEYLGSILSKPYVLLSGFTLDELHEDARLRKPTDPIYSTIAMRSIARRYELAHQLRELYGPAESVGFVAVTHEPVIWNLSRAGTPSPADYRHGGVTPLTI